jgi:hypothetical protein
MTPPFLLAAAFLSQVASGTVSGTNNAVPTPFQRGSSLVFRHRVVIHHGDPVQARVADAYRRFAADEQ